MAKEHVEMGGVILACGGEIAIRSEVEPGECKVAESSKRLRSAAEMGGVGILAEDRVTEPVFTIFRSTSGAATGEAAASE